MTSDPANTEDVPSTSSPRHSRSKMIVVSIAMAFVFAITFVIVMTLTLPETDRAYGQMPFEDPLVFPVMSYGALFAGLFVSIPFYYACRSLPLGRSVAIIVGVTMLELLIVTPFNAGIGLLGSFVAFAIGLAAVRVMWGPSRSVVASL